MSERYPSILATRLGVEHNVTRIGVPTEERILKSGESGEISWMGWYLGSVATKDGEERIATAELGVVVEDERLRRELGDSALCFAYIPKLMRVNLVNGSEYEFNNTIVMPDGSRKRTYRPIKIGRGEQPDLPCWISRDHCEITRIQAGSIRVDNHSSSDMQILIPDMSRHILPPGDSHNNEPVRHIRADVVHKADKDEDAYCLDKKHGILSVFDGVGGLENGAQAARFAAGAVRKFAEDMLGQNAERQPLQEAMKWNIEALNAISMAIRDRRIGGSSTATLSRIIKQPDGSRFLTYANMGDSRIYIVRDNKACQITEDDGEGSFITASLGGSIISKKTPWQYGCVKILPGDTILVGTDGIWGDYGSDVMSDGEISLLVQSMHAKGVYNPKLIAQALLDRSRKHDDKTLIVASCS
ncbi:hypothetical protein EUA66_02235 [TM7 phylum sp. oral taxon 349]|jgi:hypothetical protein|nr:SpoIIE family protein phosphatase [TM7 phylum sp. oral taxon 349]TWP22681.1 hypothetical protein EUA66_02235 [TM7 phylum sp. oral taxon 349]